tara:strand:- start:1357 stop:1893 length:537 start_codon:yes stop_codon:yes gene_type:complete
MNKCSKFFSYEDIYQCGETWYENKESISNIPKEKATYEGIKKLCENILDPIQKKFGKIELTYGFASLELTKKIKGRIYPVTDQHAGYEKKDNGEYICRRLGQAVDFKIEGIDSLQIGQWIIDNLLPFDRLYFYESKRPLHISYGPNQKKQIIFMREYEPNKRVPQVIKNFDILVKAVF